MSILVLETEVAVQCTESERRRRFNGIGSLSTYVHRRIICVEKCITTLVTFINFSPVCACKETEVASTVCAECLAGRRRRLLDRGMVVESGKPNLLRGQ